MNCNLLLLCNNINDTLTYIPFLSFKSCESLVSYIASLDMSRKLPSLYKMARRSKLFGPR